MKSVYSIIFFIFISGKCYSEQITSIDLKTIQYADIYSAENVLIKLKDMYNAEGEYSLESVIPAVNNRILTILYELNNEKRYLGDAEGEFLGDLIWVLSVAGDMRAKEALLNAMVSPYIFGEIISKGLFKLGPIILPDILNYYYTENKEYIKKAIPILIYFAEKDSTGNFFPNNSKNKIKQKLVTLVKDNDEMLRYFSVKALGFFGDSTVIPLLNEIRESDIIQFNNGVYPVRSVANESIKRLERKK